MVDQGGSLLRVLHLCATNQRRGAEVFAADLIGAVGDVEHEMVHLRSVAGTAVTFPCPSRSLGARGGLLGLLSAGRDLRRLASEFRPDVVQVHGGEPLRLAILAGLAWRVPLVYRRIGMAPPPMTRGWRRRWHRWLMGRAAAVVCVSESTRVEALQRFGLDPERTLTIPNAVDPVRLAVEEDGQVAARALLGVPPDARVVLSLGALSWEKDPLRALDVTRKLLEGDGRTRHIFAGDGPLRPRLEARVAELALTNQVVLAGSRDDVGRVLAASDVVLFVSRLEGMEGMPATLIEAGLAARPVVAVSVAGAGEVVDSSTGVIVGPGDHEGLRAAVRDLLEDPARRQALGSAAADRCEERFTIGAVAPLYRRVWEQVVSRD